MSTPKSELLPVMPMDDVVVLPHMTVTLAVEGDTAKAAIEAARQGNRLVLLVPRIDGHFGSVGTVARLGDSAELPTGAEAFMIRGEYRARLGRGQAGIGGAVVGPGGPCPRPPSGRGPPRSSCSSFAPPRRPATWPTWPATRPTSPWSRSSRSSRPSTW